MPLNRNLALPFSAGYVALDACCRIGAEWGTSRMSDCLMSDNDLACRPAVAADFTRLPYADGTFDRIYWDPPHMIRRDKWTTKYEKDWRNFKAWPSRQAWHAALDGVNSEFARVGSDRVVLHVKILDGKDRRVVNRAETVEHLSAWTIESERREPPATPWSTADVVFLNLRRKP